LITIVVSLRGRPFVGCRREDIAAQRRDAGAEARTFTIRYDD